MANATPMATTLSRGNAVLGIVRIRDDRENAAGRQGVAQEIAEFQSTINYLEKKEQSLRDKERSIRGEHRQPVANVLEQNKKYEEKIIKLEEEIKFKAWAGEGCVCSRCSCTGQILTRA